MIKDAQAEPVIYEARDNVTIDETLTPKPSENPNAYPMNQNISR
jgi:hypothetical protein